MDTPTNSPSPRPAPLDARWRHSSFSTGANSTCVDVATRVDAATRELRVAVRDSKDPHGPALVFTPDEWRVFLNGVRAGEFELPLGVDPGDHNCSSRAPSRS